MDEQKDRIKSYFYKIVQTEVDADLLDYAVDELLSRTMLYLNMTEVPQAFEMTLVHTLIAQVSQYEKEDAGIDGSGAIDKLEDNNQSISYGQRLLNYFATQPDNVIFASASGVLNRYRLANVVFTEDDDDETA